MMRGTLHLVSARDYRRCPALQPMLTAGMESILRERGGGLDHDAVLAAARARLAGDPRTFEELRAAL